MSNNDMLKRILLEKEQNGMSNTTPVSYNNVFINNLTKSNITNEDKKKIEDMVRESVTKKFSSALISKANDTQFKAEVNNFIKECIGQIALSGEYNINEIIKNELGNKIYNDIIGFGPLQSLLQDENITEIMVTAFNKIYVEKKGVMTLVPEIKFDSEEHLKNTIQKIVQPMGKKIDDSEPICDTSLPDGSRVNATFPPASPDGATLTIRKFSKCKLGPQDYLNFGSLNQDMIDFLKFAVLGKANIIVAGGTGTGKTTLLNMISQFIPDTDAIVTIEDTLELQLQQQNVRSLLARKPVNGKGEITIRDLVKNTLRMRPDRIDVGEIRGGEIYDMLDSMSSGHEGGMGTIHTKSPSHLVNIRIPILMAMSDIRMEEKAQKKMIADAIDLIVYIKRFPGGARKITNITEVCGYGEEGARRLKLKDKDIDNDKIYLKDIFQFKEKGINKDGVVEGEYVSTGYIPKRILNKAAIYTSKKIDQKIFTKKDNLDTNDGNKDK